MLVYVSEQLRLGRIVIARELNLTFISHGHSSIAVFGRLSVRVDRLEHLYVLLDWLLLLKWRSDEIVLNEKQLRAGLR